MTLLVKLGLTEHGANLKLYKFVGSWGLKPNGTKSSAKQEYVRLGSKHSDVGVKKYVNKP